MDDSLQETRSRDPLEYFKELYQQDRVLAKSQAEKCCTLPSTVIEETPEDSIQLEPDSQTHSQSADHEVPDSPSETRDLQADHSSVQKP